MNIEELFEEFWKAGMVKVKKKAAKKLFIKIVGKMPDPEIATQDLIGDIQARLRVRQLGFDAMHPTTYLNQERWTDEIREASNEGRQAAESHAERVNRQASQAREQLGITYGGICRDSARPLRGIG